MKQNSEKISYVLQYSEKKCSRLYLLVTLPLNPIAAIIAHTATGKSDLSLGASIGVVQMSVKHAAITSVRLPSTKTMMNGVHKLLSICEIMRSFGSFIKKK